MPPRASPGPHQTLRVFESAGELTAALVTRLAQAVSGAASVPAALMLSGGNTPLPAYRALAAQHPAPAPGLTLLYCDERYVAASSPDSNYFQSRVLIEALALPAERVLRVRTELPLLAAASDYAARLADLERRGIRIALGLLGLGADGHTASLFSAADIARAAQQRAVAVHRPDGRDAVTVTPSVLQGVGELLFVVAGADKRAALARLRAGERELPACGAVAARAEIEIWADRQACPQA